MPEPAAPPSTFGKYYLTEKLATGGMAEIYLAKLLGPLGFEKQLVIKQIHPRFSGQRAFVDLFVAEAKTLVALNHGNIVPVYELGVVDDTYFIAMEYLDGPTLLRFTDALAARSEALPPPLAAWIAAEILAGLDHAHRKGEGVIHRDLSPRNVMLSRDGEVKLVDFGIAVTLGSAGEGSAGAPTGSFPYMSPEQVRREALTAQSDLFSTGVLLWEMLTGQRLFARATPEEILAAVEQAPVPTPSSITGPSAAPLDAVVMKALARDPAERWPSAAEFRAALARYLYALDPAPGARDLAPLIARACPPHVRRSLTSDDSGPAHAEPEGPSTAVMSPEASPRGKARPRARTFATHVELERALERATPFAGVPIIDEPGSTPAPAPAHAQPAPRRAWPLVVGVVLVAGAILVIASVGGGDAPRRAGATTTDARALASAPADARPTLTVAPGDARPPPDATASLRSDAATRPARDAGRLRVDARPAAAVVDAAPARTGRLKVGAAPWGEIRIDGVARGRTPRAFDLPAGAHEVEITLPTSTPLRTETFRITLAGDDERSVFADFTR